MNPALQAREYDWLAEMYVHAAKNSLAARDVHNALVRIHGAARCTAEAIFWRYCA